MASTAPTQGARPPRAKPISADRFERLLAVGAALLLLAVVAALVRGAPEWSRVPWQVWPHLFTIALALALTPVILLRRRGDARHRWLGRLWVAAMIATAALSFNLRTINPGQWSFIHLLSAWTLVQAPLIWWSAATHRLRLHRSTVRGMVTGALLVAGFFTFPFNRLLGHWLFG
jgi:uncharacterized membrane protein